MSAGHYTGPGWYRIRWQEPGQPAGATRVVWIGSKYAPGYGADWLAVWLTRDDHSEVMMEGRQSTLMTTIIGRISADAA
jgi:hypothetical protein